MFLEERIVSTKHLGGSSIICSGNIDRLVRLGHVNVKTGRLGNGERKKQGPEHGMS